MFCSCQALSGRNQNGSDASLGRAAFHPDYRIYDYYCLLGNCPFFKIGWNFFQLSFFRACRRVIFSIVLFIAHKSTFSFELLRKSSCRLPVLTWVSGFLKVVGPFSIRANENFRTVGNTVLRPKVSRNRCPLMLTDICKYNQCLASDGQVNR